MHLFRGVVSVSELILLLQPLLYLPPVYVVFGGDGPLIASAEIVLVITLDRAQFEVNAVTLTLLQRGRRTLFVFRGRIHVVIAGLELLQCVGILQVIIVVDVGQKCVGATRRRRREFCELGTVFAAIRALIHVIQVRFEQFYRFWRGRRRFILQTPAFRRQIPHVVIGTLHRQVHGRLRGGELGGGTFLVVPRSGLEAALLYTLHAISEITLSLQPLLYLSPVYPVFPSSRPLIALAIGVVPVRIQHLQLEMRGEDAS